jgi:LmbE family N-acetylglucosaminyl deacetylase
VALIVDKEHLGPSVDRWNARMLEVAIPPLKPLRARRLIVIAPHPDDEVLGAGGLIQEALREGVLVEIVSLTDGEASHPHSTVLQDSELASTRRRESQVALRRLGWHSPAVTYLGLPDGRVAEFQAELDSALASILLPDDLCVAPWINDGHPDHNVSGESALRVGRSVGAKSLGYLVWAWHWADPEGADIPWNQCVRLDLGRRSQARKRWSTLAFESQIRPLGPSPDDAEILPVPLLRRFWRPYEVFVDVDTSP